MKRNIYILFIFLIGFCVLEYNDEITDQYSYADTESKRNYLENIIDNRSDLDEAVSDTIDELLKVPDKLLISYLKNGGKVIITGDFEFEYVAGSFSVTKLCNYIIKVSPEYIDYATLHEVGHYLAYIQGINNDRRFKECLKEKEQALNEVLNQNKYFSDESEYFAEMFKLYCKGDLNEDDYPITTGYIKDLLSDL